MTTPNDIQINKIAIQNFKGIHLVEYEEYKKLENENINLTLRILELGANEKKFQNQIESNNITIQELKKQNEELKKENDLLREKIKDLELNNKFLNEKIDKLEFNNDKLTTMVENLMHKSLYDNYIVAIQDLNKHFTLENKIPNIEQELKELRENRNRNNHYLNKKDKSEMISNKLAVLEIKLKNIPKDIEEEINDNYPNVISEILNSNIFTNSIQPQTDVLNKINKWWS
jgi:predicted nuclease with TOPRIM domain